MLKKALENPKSEREHFKIDSNFGIKKIETKALEKKKMASNFPLAKFLNVGYYLVTPLLFGVFFGLLIDNFLKTKPFFITIFIFLGSLGTFYNLWRLTKE